LNLVASISPAPETTIFYPT